MMRIALAAALSALLSSSLVAEGVTRPAMPAEKGGRISSRDYPEESLRRGERGMTTVEYQVNEQGMVTPQSCVVAASSGHPRLDRRSCEVVEDRFRFEPALRDGLPVRETRQQAIFWNMPGHDRDNDLATAATRMVHGNAICLARNAQAVARRLVDLPFGDAAQDALIKRLDAEAPNCAEDWDRVETPNQLLVGATAEALFKARFADKPSPQLATDAGPLQPRNGIEALAHCVVRRDPTAVKAMLATVPTGTAEAVAAAKLIPHLQPCIVAGTTLRFTKPAMRSLFAYALYRDTAHAAGDR